MEDKQLVFYPAEVLRKVAVEVDEVNDDIKKLLDYMLEKMYVERGVGLAAPQIGESLRMFVMDVSEMRDNPLFFVNPEIIEQSDELCEVEEGCLSLPGFYAKVARPKKIKITALDKEGKEFSMSLSGYDARCFLHEFDHLEGKLFIDYLSPLKKQMAEKKIKKFKKSRGL